MLARSTRAQTRRWYLDKTLVRHTPSPPRSARYPLQARSLCPPHHLRWPSLATRTKCMVTMAEALCIRLTKIAAPIKERPNVLW